MTSCPADRQHSFEFNYDNEVSELDNKEDSLNDSSEKESSSNEDLVLNTYGVTPPTISRQVRRDKAIMHRLPRRKHKGSKNKDKSVKLEDKAPIDSPDLSESHAPKRNTKKCYFDVATPPSPMTLHRFRKKDSSPTKCVSKLISVGDLTRRKRNKDDSTWERASLPSDRIKFFKTISILLDAGNPNRRKNSTNELRDTVSEPSSPERLTYNAKEVNELHQLIWYAVQAWKYNGGDKLIVRKFDDTVQHINKLILQNITPCFNRILLFSFDSINSNNLLNTNTHDNNFSTIPIFQQCVDLIPVVSKIKDGIVQIEDILDEYFGIQHLYWSHKDFENDNKNFFEDNKRPLKVRQKTLCIWLNIATQLSIELHSLAHILYVDDIHNLYWPFLNFMPPSMPEHPNCPMHLILPDYFSTDEEIDENIKCRKNLVKFDFGECDKQECNIHHSSSVMHFNDRNETTSTIIFRPFVEKSLRRSGLKKIETWAKSKLLPEDSVLKRLKIILSSEKICADKIQSIRSELLLKHNESSQNIERSFSELDHSNTPLLELYQYGEHSDEWKKMNLPSFRELYLFTNRISFDIAHECLRYRLEQAPIIDDMHTSLLTIDHLLKEGGDILRVSVQIKKYYLQMITDIGETSDIRDFDNDLQNMLDLHIGYLKQYLSRINEEESNLSIHLSRFESEWKFLREICPMILQGEAKIGNSFCDIVTDLFEISTDSFSLIVNVQTGKLQSFEEEEDDESNSCKLIDFITKTCREIKTDLFDEHKERSTRVMALAKMLRNDLEIACQYKIIDSYETLLEKLYQTRHIQICLKTSLKKFLVFVPESMSNDTNSIRSLIRATSCLGITNCDTDQHNYIIMLIQNKSYNWKGKILKMEADIETEISWSHLEFNGLLVLTDSRQMNIVRGNIEKLFGSKLIELDLGQTACHKAVNESLIDLKKNALIFQNTYVQGLKEIATLLCNLNRNPIQQISNSINDTLKKMYNFGFDLYIDIFRLLSRKDKELQSTDMIDFAINFMSLSQSQFDKGRGVRPNWIGKFFDYIRFISTPEITQYLSNESFKKFKDELNSCINHVIGDATSPQQIQNSHHLSTSYSFPDGRRISLPKQIMDLKAGESFSLFSRSSSMNDINESHETKRQHEIEKLDEKLERKLLKGKIIGKVSKAMPRYEYTKLSSKLKIGWHGRRPLGKGSFGNVYTVVNTKTQQLMVMKQQEITPGDYQKVKEIADEVKTFVNLKHEGLVQYFGIETHYDEILIFMEYCPYGTLETASRDRVLKESTIRFYTKKIVHAVAYLHENKILHRDLKGQNIFLTPNSVKVGDFGSYAKFKYKSHGTEKHTTQGTTIRFQPQEVITKAPRHGPTFFKADIWSIGCIVMEMVTGNIPWYEQFGNINNVDFPFMMWLSSLNSTSIIDLGESVKGESRKFMERCLVIDQNERPTAEELLDDAFIKIDDEQFS